MDSPKRGLGWQQPTKSFFWHEINYRIVFRSLLRLYFEVGVIAKCQAKSSFGRTATKDLTTGFSTAQLMSYNSPTQVGFTPKHKTIQHSIGWLVTPCVRRSYSGWVRTSVCDGFDCRIQDIRCHSHHSRAARCNCSALCVPVPDQPNISRSSRPPSDTCDKNSWGVWRKNTNFKIFVIVIPKDGFLAGPK